MNSNENVTEAKSRSIWRAFLPTRATQWFGVAFTLLVLAGLGGAAAAVTGLVNLSAVPPHPAGWAHLLHYGMSRSVARHASSAPPSKEPLDSHAMVMRGAAQYAMVCANCHGAPGFGQSPIALSLRPEPPMIVDATKQLSDQELYFIVANGVRYTGMPAWPVQNRPDEIWAMVAFLKAMPGMDRSTYLQLALGETIQGVRGVDRPVGGQELTDHQARATPLAPFVPSKNPRPYLAGDPQTEFPSPGATVSPRTGFSNVAMRGDPSASCTTCHGARATGRSGGAFPNLTLQSPQYIYDALHAFASGQRQSGIMWPIASSLSEDEMRAIATKIGAAPALPSQDQDQEAEAGAISRGAEVALAGVSVPAPKSSGSLRVERCSSCHIAGAYLSKVMPALNGQRAAYLRMQLELFRAGGRGDTGSYDPMMNDSHDLGEADIAAVADYYSSLQPLLKKQNDL